MKIESGSAGRILAEVRSIPEYKSVLGALGERDRRVIESAVESFVASFASGIVDPLEQASRDRRHAAVMVDALFGNSVSGSAAGA